MSKKSFNILKWLVIILLISNMATGITLVVHLMKEANEVSKNENFRPDRNNVNRPHHGRMWEELDFTPEQESQFHQFKQQYRQEAKVISIELQKNRELMFEELHKDQIDTIKIKTLTKEIGELHTSLKLLTVDFYLGMKDECTPEQQEKLFHFFSRMSEARPEFGYRRHHPDRRHENKQRD